ncbi:MAG: HAD-IB family hydrolase [Sporocytophaga sp.]|uniref:HAD-IB family hydrolase n=1 Tax=Sporocytophaga sp. TaxID=2231183 RepID=UPI001B16C87C|nr:HAD-IB family hydrolase [Sporocytophaga sp.]MBO9701589.1 HAD-IB family hydrolase [Sporocytophaga sp.]
MENKVALFDFDGTLTRKDTLAEFIRYCHGTPKFLFGLTLLSPLILIYKAGLLSNSAAKKAMLSYFFKGWDIDVFQRKGEEFANKIIPGLLKKDGIERLNWHLSQGHRVIIVTASVENWINSWTNELKIELVGTRLEVKDGKLTGNYLDENCHGIEKVNRLETYQIFNRSHYIYGYGDTKGDLPFLKLSNESFYKYFKN